jgi:hypothetical protein
MAPNFSGYVVRFPCTRRRPVADLIAHVVCSLFHSIWCWEQGIVEGLFYTGMGIFLVAGMYFQITGWYEKTAKLRAVKTTTYEGF